MCGIFAYLGCQCTSEQIKPDFDRIRYRGPDDSRWLNPNDLKGLTWGFHRLAINGLSHESDEPLRLAENWLICNGEIFNSRELAECFQFKTITQNDCESILHLYQYYGPNRFQEVLTQLDGVYSFILYDGLRQLMFVANDPIGIRPLYWSSIHAEQPISDLASQLHTDLTKVGVLTQNTSSSGYWPKNLEVAWASEPIALSWTHNPIYFFPPGTFMRIDLELRDVHQIKTMLPVPVPVPVPVPHQTTHSNPTKEAPTPETPVPETPVPDICCTGFAPAPPWGWGKDSQAKGTLVPIKYQFQRWYQYLYMINFFQSDADILTGYHSLLKQAVRKRLLSDRPVGTLLSGGIDSSLVTALTAEAFKELKYTYPLETFSIGLAGSPDLKWAQMVATYLGTKHNPITVTEAEFLTIIPEVIRAIQSYDITTVRASCGNWLLGKYIKANSQAVVILNGDVSEEIHASYYYSSQAPNPLSYYHDNLDLLKAVHRYDVLRSARSMENHSLECRTPFADQNLVRFVMSIDPRRKMFQNSKTGTETDSQQILGEYDPKNPTVFHRMEKALIRKAFLGTGLLEDKVLLRKKTAFSDGVSDQSRSWFQIIQEHIDRLVTDQEFTSHRNDFSPNPPPTKEAYYYRKIYESVLPNQGHLIPAYWMPRFIAGVKDPSARVLANYAE